MAELTLKRWLGLVTAPNQLDLPAGALTTATNVSLERDGLLMPRKGLSTHSSDSTDKNTNRLWEFAGSKMKHGDNGNSDFRLTYYTGGAWTAVTGPVNNSFRHPDGTTGDFKLHQVEINDRLCVAESVGLIDFASASAAFGFLGAPKCPDLDRSNSSTADATGGVLAPQTQRAYRALLELRPQGAPPQTGVPSGRMILRNENAGAGSNQKPTVRVLLPKANNTTATALAASTTWVQLYASSITAALTEDPLEDFALIADYQLTSTDITNGYVNLEDVTPDALRGQSLYTNPFEETIGGANEPPPHAKCVARYKDCLVAANTVTRQRLEFQILSVDSTDGILDGDTLTFDQNGTSFTITAKTAPTTSDHYALVTSASASMNIALTAQNLVAAINRHTSNTFCYAYYLGIPDDPRSIGRILVESRQVNAEPIGPYVGSGDNQACFEPQMPAGSASNDVLSVEDAWSNGWALSKPSQPYAWPLAQTGRMGAGSIVWVAALDEACFFFHDSGEVWMMTGEPPRFGDPGTLQVSRRYTNLTLLAPQSVYEMEGRLIALTDRGVVAIAPSGYEVLSGAIQAELRDLIASAGPTSLRRKTWAVVHPQEQRYVLGIYDTTNTRWVEYEFYLASRSSGGGVGRWVKSSISDQASTGYYSNADDAVYFGESVSSGSARVLKQANGSDSSTYNDNSSAYTCSMTTAPIIVGDPASPKQVREVQLAFEGDQPTSVTVQVTTELGSASVGAVASQGTNLLRVTVPQSVQRGIRHQVLVSIAEANKRWRLASMTLLYRSYDTKGTK